MNSYITVTTYAPESMKPGTLRNAVFDAFYSNLKAIRYPKIKCLLVGSEPPKQEGNIYWIKSTGLTKGEKLIDAKNYLLEHDLKSDYITRLDDDDFICSDALHDFAHATGDVLCDKMHAFMDLTTGKFSSQTRPWIANTALHRFDHAFQVTPLSDESGLMFNCNHADCWLPYYQDKHIEYAAQEHPLYVRLLSPTSITSSGSASITSNQVNFDQGAYKKYVRTFGKFSSSAQQMIPQEVMEKLLEIRNTYFSSLKTPRILRLFQ